MQLIKLRSIDEAYREIKEEDQNTCLTKNMIRKLCDEKKVKNFIIGRKRFIDFDDLIEKINSFAILE